MRATATTTTTKTTRTRTTTTINGPLLLRIAQSLTNHSVGGLVEPRIRLFPHQSLFERPRKLMAFMIHFDHEDRFVRKTTDRSACVMPGASRNSCLPLVRRVDQPCAQLANLWAGALCFFRSMQSANRAATPVNNKMLSAPKSCVECFGEKGQPLACSHRTCFYDTATISHQTCN